MPSNRWSARDKAARFKIARAECAECDATLAMLAGLRLASSDDIRPLRHLSNRVGAMLTGLIRREERRAVE